MIDPTTEVPIPSKYSDMNSFCNWAVNMALKPILSKAAISEMRGHKWWIMRNYSDGKETSELYSMFINVDVNRTSATPYNTVIVSWSPKAFSWGVITKLIKFLGFSGLVFT